MIGCDNDFCEYEWFHYSCVGNHEELRVRVVSLFLCRKPRGNVSTSGFTILVWETTRKCEYEWFHYWDSTRFETVTSYLIIIPFALALLSVVL